MNLEPIHAPPSVTKLMRQLDAVMRDPGLEIEEVSQDILSFDRLRAKKHYIEGQLIPGHMPRSFASWASQCGRQDMLDWLYQWAVNHHVHNLMCWAVLCRQPNQTLTQLHADGCPIDTSLTVALDENNVEAAKQVLTLAHEPARNTFIILRAGIAVDELLLLIPGLDCNWVDINNVSFAMWARAANLGLNNRYLNEANLQNQFSVFALMAQAGHLELINRYLNEASQENINAAFYQAVNHTDVALALLPHIDCIQKFCVNGDNSPLLRAYPHQMELVQAILVAGIVDYRDERNAPGAPEFLKGKRKGCSKMDKVKASNALIAVIKGEAGEETLQEHMKALTNKRLNKFYELYLTFVKGTGKKPAYQRASSDCCDGGCGCDCTCSDEARHEANAMACDAAACACDVAMQSSGGCSVM